MPFWGFWLGGWERRRRELISCTRHSSRCWRLFLILKWWGRRKKTEQCFVNLILEATYIKGSSLVSLAAWWWIASPSGDSPALTQGGRCSYRQLFKQRAWCAGLWGHGIPWTDWGKSDSTGRLQLSCKTQERCGEKFVIIVIAFTDRETCSWRGRIRRRLQSRSQCVNFPHRNNGNPTKSMKPAPSECSFFLS